MSDRSLLRSALDARALKPEQVGGVNALYDRARRIANEKDKPVSSAAVIDQAIGEALRFAEDVLNGLVAKPEKGPSVRYRTGWA